MRIVFEGCEASGKSYLLTTIFGKLVELGYIVRVREFPRSSSKYGSLARKALKRSNIDSIELTLLCILDLLAASKEIDPNVIYLEGRSKISTLVYNDLGNTNIDFSSILSIIPDPDLLVYLDTPIDLVTQRLARRSIADKNDYDNINNQVCIKDLYAKYIKDITNLPVIHLTTESVQDQIKQIVECIHNYDKS